MANTTSTDDDDAGGDLSKLPKSDDGTNDAAKSATSTSDGFGHYGESLAYDALNACAEDIRGRVLQAASKKGLGIKLLVLDTLDYASGDVAKLQLESLAAHFRATLVRRLDAVKAALAGLNRTPPVEATAVGPAAETAAGADAGAGATLDVIAKFMDLLQWEYTLQGRFVILDCDAVKAVVAGKLAGDFDVQILNFHHLSATALAQRLTALSALANELNRTTLALEQAVEAATARTPPTPDDQLLLPRLAQKAARDELAAYEAMVVSIMNISNAAPSLLARALLRAHIDEVRFDYILGVKPVTGAAEHVTRKGFPPENRVAFLGAATLAFALSSSAGNWKICAASVVTQLKEHKWQPFEGSVLWKIAQLLLVLLLATALLAAAASTLRYQVQPLLSPVAPTPTAALEG